MDATAISITSDVMEAVIGALYLDGGFDAAHDFIHRFILSDLENKILFYDSKTVLQEICRQKAMESFLTNQRRRRTGSQQIVLG